MTLQKAFPVNNYFELYSFPESFEINAADLKERLKTLQLENHPDKFSEKGEEEKIAAVKKSSLINDAYQVLSNPVKRANYILELNGVSLVNDRKIDHSILLEQMEIREKLEKISRIKNEAEKIRSLEDFGEELEEKFSSAQDFFLGLDRNLASARKNGQEELSNHLEKMKQALSNMLFLDKAISEIDEELELVE